MRGLAILLAFALWGCAVSNRVESPKESRPPLEVSLGQAFLAGGVLHVKVLVEAKTSFSTDQVVLTLKGLDEHGELIAEKLQRLSDTSPIAELEEGKRLAVWFELPAARVSEYEVQCSWGSDATTQLALQRTGERATRAHVLTEASGPALENVTVVRHPTACPEPPCDMAVSLKGELVNSLPRPLTKVTLLVGISWSEGGSRPVIPAPGSPRQENEDLVTFSALDILPGGRREFTVHVDDPLPVVPGGEFVPYVRILADDTTAGE